VFRYLAVIDFIRDVLSRSSLLLIAFFDLCSLFLWQSIEQFFNVLGLRNHLVRDDVDQHEQTGRGFNIVGQFNLMRQADGRLRKEA
jgi:hypothetical protein